MAPALGGSKITIGDPSVLALVLHNGIAKETQDYLGMMAPLGAALDDEKLAGVMTYVRNSFGNTASVVTVEDVKKSSSKWIKTHGPEFAGFAWQAGYGAFAVSESNVETVRAYIANQREHHRTKSFQEEYRTFLERHNIAFDERYVWD